MTDSNMRKCGVCDTMNQSFRKVCSDCGVNLSGKRKSNQSSKKNKAKKRRKRVPTCPGNKVSYPTRTDASRARKKLQKDKGIMLRIYRCNTCRGFHLTKYRS